MLNQIQDFLNSINFTPDYGDWSGALVSIVFGLISFILSIFSGIVIYFRWKKESKASLKEQERLRKAEEEQTYLTLRMRYDEIWDKLTEKGLRHLYLDYNDTKGLKDVIGSPEEISRIKTTIWQLMNHLSDIEFLYCQKQDSLYWKRWEFIFNFVFRKPIIKMAFVKNREQFAFNKSFVKLVDGIVSTKNTIIE